jgi:hypothetical protein
MPFESLVTAGTIINNVRDKIPDPVYSGSTPTPDVDGRLFRAQTLYRWLSNHIRTLTRRCNWTVEDWTALPIRDSVNSYALDARWQQISDAWLKALPMQFVDEALTVFPNYAKGNQGGAWGWHKRAGVLEVMMWPAPDFTDPLIALSPLYPAMTTTSDAINMVTGTPTTFLPYGWVQIENELIEYKKLTATDFILGVTTTLTALRRGASGTTAAAHTPGSGVNVQHCSLWMKGIRTPNLVSQASDVLEVPLPFLNVLEMYLLADCREGENDHAEAKSLRKDADAECLEIRTDPEWQKPPGRYAIRPYGSEWVGGPVYNLGPFGTIVP